MAIQRINLGTAPSGVGGDTERSAFKKIDDNFGDWGNAASRIVGKEGGNLMETGAFGFGGNGTFYNQTKTSDIKTVLGSRTQIFRTENNTALTHQYSPSIYLSTGNTFATICCGYYGQGVRIAGWQTNGLYDDNLAIYDLYHKKSVEIYNTTTASSPNVFVTPSGELQRSTSSERYKKDIEHISLNDQQYQAIRKVKPIAYKSTTEVDNPNWTFQSFSAEELAKASPTLVLWEYEETVIDEGTGLQVTRPLAQRRPAGLNLNSIVALQHAVSLKQADLIDAQAKQIKDLTKRITALEAK